MKKPNWKEWAHTPNVRVWQACALSLNIDPHAMQATSTGWMSGPGHGPFFEDESFPDDDTKAEFELRERVLLANLSNRDHFSAGILSMSTPGNHGVNLAEFATWAAGVVQWDNLPAELLAMAITPELSANAGAVPAEGFASMSLRLTKEKIAEHWAQRGLEAVLAQQASTSTGAPVAPIESAREDWRVKARSIADECFDKDTDNNCRDSLIRKGKGGKITGGYAYRVMELMQQRKIHGPRGLIDNPATISREALQGGKWWANKNK
jgi:hypothetical protein